MRLFKLVSGLTFLAISIAGIIGCQTLTNPDGSKSYVLNPATTQAIGGVKTTAETVGTIAAVVPVPGSTLIHDISLGVASIAGILLTYDSTRRKGNAEKNAAVASAVNEHLQTRLTEAGISTPTVGAKLPLKTT